MSEPIQLTPGPSDRDMAGALRTELEHALKVVLAVMTKAEASGLRAEFSLGRDGYGRNVLVHAGIVRPLA